MIPVRVISPYANALREVAATGHVHSVFRTSLNIDIAGRLVHVGGDGEPLSCLGMRVDGLAMPHLVACLRAGHVAVARGGALRLYSPNGVMELDLRAARVTSCSLAPCMERESALWGFARLSGLALARRVGLAFDEGARAVVSAMTDASSSREDEDRAIGYLVGRGRGLTPSGDDILLGYAAALRACGIESDIARRVVDAARRRTTDVSFAYLDAFSRGWSNPVYGQLARAIADRDDAAFERTVRIVGGIGHTSGWDGLLGFRWGLARAYADAPTLAARPLCA